MKIQDSKPKDNLPQTEQLHSPARPNEWLAMLYQPIARGLISFGSGQQISSCPSTVSVSVSFHCSLYPSIHDCVPRLSPFIILPSLNHDYCFYLFLSCISVSLPLPLGLGCQLLLLQSRPPLVAAFFFSLLFPPPPPSPPLGSPSINWNPPNLSPSPFSPVGLLACRVPIGPIKILLFPSFPLILKLTLGDLLAF
ncbi:uncharacterized protein BP01DRAFT_241251 [Aspergillus saccharolyticus JOP 1030-1]|uniref:Uncharacterized protein n=1 Tax=Aspergillus saccharolyticus JOP 1030-1 TaxID=1450539 RepID=A0A318ZJH5_9EURO|nr:hypothetical protein BP01DRAFT_241251 [Aspergillus saccharolyticus JOP 1030-1]PYH46955.1 hypothetical protein BP01DRAFT_241251 [Aspergillus saccharolyticus JOP 1030-1]